MTLHGGVRGWAETLGCAAGYPKMLFRLLEQYGYVAGVDYYPGAGGQVVAVQLARPDDHPVIVSAPPTGPAPAAEAHQDAAADPPVRSVIESPHTPLYGTHESLQQQQHAREDTEPDTALTQLLRAEFPRADAALLAAWEANPQVNDCKAARDALLGFPTATCANWQADLAAAEDRPTVAWPVGLVLACWAQGERVTPRRAAPVAPPAAPPVPRRRGREPRPVEARAPEAVSDREIRADTDLAPEERAAFLAAYEAAPDDAARAEVLCDFRRFWAAWFEEQLAQERAVGA
ncbi:MAG: hypothetical protein HGA45_38065, partial [Chloroflexales bacterium]|nr:hypothetical protein [Chloroflexales bacterium]